jgi:catechol 2,3-dioxygenase-like lactoylglutathione lyase family enzyme
MITAIDHIVLTVRNIDATAAFYKRTLGIETLTFGTGRRALKVGDQKINLHTLGMETRNHATIGAGDICLLTSATPDEVVAKLLAENIAINEGPVERSGAHCPIISVYFTDPDGHLIEISSYM